MKRSLAVFASLVFFSLVACTEESSDECPKGQSRCGEQCVDWMRDPANCGACGTVCGDGFCDAGRCVVGCPDSKESCNGACVDLDSDHGNCGACGAACAADEVCHRGSCGSECGKGLSPCQQGCVELQSDPTHCGACGNVCPADEVCSSGKCGASCEEGLRNCDGACVDLQENDANCGTCGNACEDGRRCTKGQCLCPAGHLVCDDSARCVDVTSDAANCGDCGVSCLGGERVQGASCEGGLCNLECSPGYADCDGRHENGCERNLRDDPAHCGACGNACGAGQICENHKCVCPADATACPSGCANLAADPSNCGACGKRCADLPNVTDASTCHESECVIFCQEGKWGNCNGDPNDGCEASLLTDPLHCGACNHDCNELPNVVNAGCAEGTCVFACEEGWEDCDGDPSNGCEGDLSVLVMCGASCADLDSDRDHCGACDNGCTVACRDKTCIEVAALPQPLGPSHSCALLTDGTARCWGNGANYQLGDGEGGTGHLSLIPVPVLAAQGGPTLDGITELALGGGSVFVGAFTCARLEDATVHCWGRSDKGQAGVLTGGTAQFPNRIERAEGVPLSGVRAIAAGGASACALLEADGSVHCWGANNMGQLGDGSTVDSRYAREVRLQDDEPLRGAVQIAAGDTHACALLEGGTVRCWGEGTRGQLGNTNVGGGTTSFGVQRAVPVLVAEGGAELEGVDEIDANGAFSCARSGDRVQCWGEGMNGQLGSGTTSLKSFPVTVEVKGGGELTGVTRIAVGGSHVCALRADTSVHCWGQDQYGALGTGGSTNQPRAVPATRASDEAPLVEAVEIAAGWRHSCARLADGAVLCWGSHAQGQIGDGGEASSESRRRAVPVAW